MAARARGAGVTGYAIGMVIFIILFVISLVFAILAYTQIDKAQQLAASTEAKYAKMVRPAEERDPAIEKLIGEANSRVSVVGTLHDENRKLKQFLGVDQTLPLGDEKNQPIQNLLKAAGLDVAEQSAIGMLNKLQAELADRQNLLKQAVNERKQAEMRIAEYDKQKAAAAEEFQKAKDSLEKQLNDLLARQKSYTGTVTDNQQKLEKQLADIQAAYQQYRETADKKIEEQAQAIRVKDAQIASLMIKTKPVSVDPERYAELFDAKILSVVTGDNLVYINRGRKDHIWLGLTFGVFDTNTRPEWDERLKEYVNAKGTVEVVRVDQNTSVARIVSTSRGATINEGDSLINVVYDPNTAFKFYVFGDFDIDRAGAPSSSDRKRVEAMVTAWGSQVVDKLTYDTDFVVLGIEPKLPEGQEPKAEDGATPDVIEAWLARQRRYEAYNQAESQARSFGIPVLNQNRFLALVGYHQR
ncbi:MAG: hypothetical protein WD042_04070 [Phycisphaeraceae bacterium]